MAEEFAAHLVRKGRLEKRSAKHVFYKYDYTARLCM
jgi:hypothetical protein